jgi:hypothetical protein
LKNKIIIFLYKIFFIWVFYLMEFVNYAQLVIGPAGSGKVKKTKFRVPTASFFKIMEIL